MMRSPVSVLCMSTALFMVGCGEKPQTLGGIKGDVAPYQGADSKFTAPGWKAGDKTSWEQALKARARNTQNEYSRASAQK